MTSMILEMQRRRDMGRWELGSPGLGMGTTGDLPRLWEGACCERVVEEPEHKCMRLTGGIAKHCVSDQVITRGAIFGSF